MKTLVVIAFSLEAALACFAQSPTSVPSTQPQHTEITVSPDTTVLTGPLRPDGTVDFVAAINAQNSQASPPKTTRRRIW